LVLCFALLGLAAFVLFGDTSSGVTGLTLLVYGGLLLLSLALARRGAQRTVVTLVFSGFLVATLIVVVAQPFLVPVLILAPLLAVGVALPSASERTLKYMFPTAWFVAVVVGTLGEVVPSDSSLPEWYRGAFSIAALATAVAIVLLLLWQFRSRLLGMLSQMRAAEERAVYDARHDPLTGLPNRTLFVEHLERALERAKRDEGSLCAVLFLDLDRFKNVNDSLGHMTGDLLLTQTARRLAASVHPADMVARLGGDEFTILLEDLTSVENAERIAKRICAELEKPFKVKGQDLYSTVSVGVVSNLAGYAGPEEILRDADTAMYRAKEEGRARYKVFEPHMRKRAIRLMRLETALRRAVEREEFVVYYQPILSLRSGEVTGFEALVRWAHPTRGIVYPQEFIPLAEETELVVPIGLSVLQAACSEAKAWHAKFPDRPPVDVSVNVSTVQLSRPDFVGHVSQTLQSTGLDGHYLCLEVTESTMMKESGLTAEAIAAVRDQGVRMHIDDFGTGYSSLGSLHRFQVDALKIDRSFVEGMDEGITSDERFQIAETIVTMGHGLGMDVIAEGVSSRRQLSRLRAMGCDYAQGYLFSRPVEAPAAEALLSAHLRW
jgi:diguanylate cyclase (GGDEF)-like protein